MTRRTLDVLQLQSRLGDDAIDALVQRFYARVQQDEQLGPVFARHVAASAWPEHLQRMVRFWSTTLRGTPAGDPLHYRGDPMATHRRLDELQHAHFDRWLWLFREVADEVLPQEIADAACQRAERMGTRLRRQLS